METTKQTVTNNVTKVEAKKDLLKLLNEKNKSANVSKSISNKYLYPESMQDKKSTDKEKKSYRRKIQKTILYYLSLDKTTKESKKEFNEFCQTFISGFKNLNVVEITDLYSFHNEKEKETANKVLNSYKQIKE